MTKFLNNTTLPYLRELSRRLGKSLVFVDLETTGRVHESNFAIIEIGLVCINPHKVLETSSLVNPYMRIPYFITQLTGIDNAMVDGAHGFERYCDYFKKAAEQSILVGYNSKCFDSKGLEKMGNQHRFDYQFLNQIDVRHLFIRHRKLKDNIKSQAGSLTDAARYHGVSVTGGNAHRAGYDIALTALIAENILKTSGFSIVKEDIEKIHCDKTRNNYFSTIKQNYAENAFAN